MQIPAGDYLTVQEAAERAGLVPSRIRQIAEEIGGVRFGGGQMGVWLIPAGRLDDWIATRRSVGRPRTTVAE